MAATKEFKEDPTDFGGESNRSFRERTREAN